MPTITNPRLTLTNVGTNVRIDVTYDANFSRLESNLAGLGMTYSEVVQVIGVDPPGSTTGTALQVIALGQLPVAAGNQGQTLRRTHTRTVTRASLNEDPGLIAPDNDEIRCRIRVLAQGLPATTNDGFTNQVVLTEGGGIGQ